MRIGKGFILTALLIHALAACTAEQETVASPQGIPPPLLLAYLGATETPQGIRIRLQALDFGTGQSAIRRWNREELDRLAAALLAHPGMRIIVEGHTDSRGSAAFNDRLSLRRAQAVRQALIARGLDADRITAKGIGERRPVADNNTEWGRSRNRRVEVLLVEAPLARVAGGLQ